jgi:hypothetical protein
MKLQEAVLCIDCECLYSHANHCPQCGSQVSYPLGRALNRPVAAAGLRSVAQAREAAPRSRTVVDMATRVTQRLQSA